MEPLLSIIILVLLLINLILIIVFEVKTSKNYLPCKQRSLIFNRIC